MADGLDLVLDGEFEVVKAEPEPAIERQTVVKVEDRPEIRDLGGLRLDPAEGLGLGAQVGVAGARDQRKTSRDIPRNDVVRRRCIVGSERSTNGEPVERIVLAGDLIDGGSKARPRDLLAADGQLEAQVIEDRNLHLPEVGVLLLVGLGLIVRAEEPVG